MNVTIIGSAKNKNIVRTCFLCKNAFIMTCEDWLFNKCGCKVVDNDPDTPWLQKEDYICEECEKYIRTIKNL